MRSLPLLFLCARPRMPVELLPELAVRAAAVESWDAALLEAERHGLGPLLYRHLRAAGVRLDAGIDQQLQGLYVRHRGANAVRIRALREVLDAFETREIKAWVLKGPALMSLVYADAALRPISDLDVLVSVGDGDRARRVLRDLGFRAPRGASARRFGGHHHLPVASRSLDGLLVQVELHVDALSRDYPDSLALDTRREAPTAIEVGGRRAWTLGLHEALWHLCQHLVRPLPGPLRLIWIADVGGYAETLCERLDWDLLARRYPVVLGVLALQHGLTPLPAEVVRHLPPRVVDEFRAIADERGAWSWSSAGIASADSRIRQLQRALHPPGWWLNLRYGGRGGGVRVWPARVRHAVAVGRVLRRRAGAALASVGQESPGSDDE